MSTQFDTLAAAVNLERSLMIGRAERRARLGEPRNRPDATVPTAARASIATRLDGMARAIRTFGAVLRPSHA